MTASRTFTVQARVGAARRAATRERILDATKRLLEGGDTVAGLTVARLAEEAEVSRATFYLHFPDKRHLIEALFESATDNWDAIADQAISDPTISRDQLREIFRAGVQQGVEYRAVVAGVTELGEYDPEVREAWQAHIRRTAETMAPYLRACRPELSDAQIRTLTQTLNWMTERALQRMLGVRSEAWCGADELTDALTEIWWSLAHPAKG